MPYPKPAEPETNERSVDSQPDDFKSMREVTTRRYGAPDAEMPDLIVIDGGKGQLSSALEIIRGAGHLFGACGRLGQKGRGSLSGGRIRAGDSS